MSRPSRYLPWVVAVALFMEQLDATIVNTTLPAMAASLGVAPLSLRGVVTSYILSLAVCIPVSGWLAERFGSRRVFLTAVAMFTVSSALCGLSVSAGMLIASRVTQGIAAALMLPIGRMTIVRSYPKGELLRVMNFVILPALLGPLLGPTVGGLIVHWLSWRDIFFVNVPIGLIEFWLAHRHMPDYCDEQWRPLDVTGLILFGTGAAILSWVLEVFGEHDLGAGPIVALLAISLALLAAFVRHARHAPDPLLKVLLFRKRTFRVSVVGGFITRLGVAGMPLLLPLLYQLGLGLPAWQSGLLMMPVAAGAMGMKLMAGTLLRRFGYRRVLAGNTLLVGVLIAGFSEVGLGTPLLAIVLLSLALGHLHSLQFASLNTLVFADVEPAESAGASTLAATLQHLGLSFGLACGSLLTALFLGAVPQSNQLLVTHALHHAFLVLAAVTMLSSLVFRGLGPRDGENVSGGA